MSEQSTTERSIIVKGTSLEDAVAKGIGLLGVARSEITYEVLQQGATGRNKAIGVPFKLRVTVGGTPVPRLPDEEIALPRFSVGSTDDWEADALQRLSPDEFLALLERTEAEVVAAIDGESAQAPDVALAGIDGEVQVEVAPSRMEAFVTVTAAQRGGQEAGVAEVHAALAAAGICYGIDAVAVSEAVTTRAHRVVVARGLPPQPGVDARLRYITVGGTFEDTLPDRREVKEGMVIAVKSPPAEGASGTSVLGDLLPPHLGRDLSLHTLKGKNLRVSSDGRELVALTKGVVSLAGGKVQVESALMIERDVALETGNLDFIGDIVIQGSIRRGVSVKAGGDITVRGNVEVAIVQAGGDVTVEGGVLGRGMGIIRAKGSVTCKFVQEAKIRAGGDVMVEDYARSSDVQADRRVTVGNTVIGGQVYGATGVRVRTAGGEQEIPTTLAAGSGLRVREEAERIRAQTASLTERLAQVEAVLEALVAVERDGAPLPAAERLDAIKAVQERARLRGEIHYLDYQKLELIAQLDAARAAIISITLKAYPRTRILIDEAALELPVVTQYANFTKDPATSTIRITALT